ncbi:DUF11 domain-containing protein [Candidatus Acetothermia bacterium]|nr:DUF11 domain-containing protein [Candidatus Acetothermia bacterium]
MPAPLKNFDGLNNLDGGIPPDTNGDVGPNHYVQWVNSSFAVYRKDGTLIYGPAAGNTLWQGFGGPCESRNDGDPIALYDPLADRWLMSQPAWPDNGPPFYQCIAVSTSPDPTGSYYRYAFTFNNFNDYPKFGVWSDGYYLSINSFASEQQAQGNALVVAFERSKMLQNQNARMVFFDLSSVNPQFNGLLPADLDGPEPPTGTPNYFVQVADDASGWPADQLMIWEFRVNWNNPLASTFGQSGNPDFILNTAAFDSNLCNFSDCIPQPNTNKKLDPISDQLMYRLQYRNLGTYQALVTNHTVDVDGHDHAGIRWYELRNTGNGWGIYQQGTHSPDALNRWMGSIAMDRSGDIALGFSVSSKTMFPSIRYAGRLATDPLGQMSQGEATLIAGGGSQTDTRWGDYSMMAVDPSDDCTFWFTTEYFSSTNSGDWKTRIGSFKFPNCGNTPTNNGADLVLSNTPSASTVSAGDNIMYTLTLTNNGPQPATGVTLTDTLPAGVNFVSASPNNCQQANGIVTCSVGNLAINALAKVTIVVTTTAAGTLTNTASAQSGQADPNTSNNSAVATTTVNAPCSADVSASAPTSVTFSPRANRPARRTVRITLFNDGTTSVKIKDITTAAGAPFSVKSIASPRLPVAIAPGGKKRFTLNAERAAGLSSMSVDPLDYLVVAMDCSSTQNPTQTPMPLPVRRSPKEAVLRYEVGQLQVEFRAVNIKSARLELFSTDGHKLLDRTSEKLTMALPAVAESGAPLPNGVYLYVITMQATDGKILRSEVKKFVLKR